MPIRKFAISCVFALAACFFTQAVLAQSYSVLYSFAGAPDAGNPEAQLIFGSDGNLYGTSVQGGQSDLGAIFKLDTSGKESVLYSFTGGADGGNPIASVMQDSSGNLYGTAQSGGTLFEGTAFRLSPTQGLTVLHAFGAKKDGGAPAGGLMRDASGNLWGTTVVGGSSNRGIVFRLDSAANETVLHSFRGKTGSKPYSGVIQDAAGNLLGTTYGTQTTWGNVYKLTQSGNYVVLHTFTGKADGGSPRAGIIMDSAGMVYGTTVYGGAHRAGTVFKVDPASGQETVLYSFSGGADGGDPYGRLVMDSAGNLYGTTYFGGVFGYGTIFKLDPAGNETVLYSFTGGSDGLGPMSGMVRDGSGNLYGTTVYGGANGAGVVFKLKP